MGEHAFLRVLSGAPPSGAPMGPLPRGHRADTVITETIRRGTAVHIIVAFGSEDQKHMLQLLATGALDDEQAAAIRTRLDGIATTLFGHGPAKH